MRYKTGEGQGGLYDYQERKAELAQIKRGLDRLNGMADSRISLKVGLI